MDETQGKREMGDRDKERQRNGNRETERVREKDGGETGKTQTGKKRDRETVGKTGGGERDLGALIPPSRIWPVDPSPPTTRLVSL